jgi:hypothetical protein
MTALQSYGTLDVNHDTQKESIVAKPSQTLHYFILAHTGIHGALSCINSVNFWGNLEARSTGQTTAVGLGIWQIHVEE